jgi:hypothetical protein
MLGEHIRALKRGRWNHAIDCGDETVIHLADDGSAPFSIRRSYRPEFVSGAEVVEVVTHRVRTFPANEVVARAYSRIADPSLAAMFRSSEAFAAWCTTGRPWTAAPDDAAEIPDVAATKGAAPAKASAGARKKGGKAPARRAKAAKPTRAKRAGARRTRPKAGARAAPPAARGAKKAASGAKPRKPSHARGPARKRR